jgi:hypothetical protein
MPTRDEEVISALRKAEIAVREGCYERAERFVDRAAKRLHGSDYVEGGLTYAELDDACEAFLKETGFLSLSSLLIYIKHWLRQEGPAERAE